MKPRNKGLTRTEQNALEAQVRQATAKKIFRPDREIAKELGIQPHVLRHYKERIHLKTKIEWEQKKPNALLAEVAAFSLANIRELDEAIAAMSQKSRHHTAMVRAVKLKNQIVRDVLRLARELGLISKRARQVTVGDITFSMLDK